VAGLSLNDVEATALVRNCELPTAFLAAATQYITPFGCRIACTKPMRTVAFFVCRLPSTFHEAPYSGLTRCKEYWLLRLRSVKESSEIEIVIRPPSRLVSFRLGEIWQYRDLIRLWIRRDVTALYKQTFLGYAWYMLQALFMAGIFSIIFGKFVRIPTDGVPSLLFFMSGQICWSYVNELVQSISTTFQTNVSLFGKIYFPRLAIPLAQIVVYAIKFFIQVFVLFGIVVYYQISGGHDFFSAKMFLVPLIVLQMGLLSLGTGLCVAAFTTRYRDLNFVLAFLMQIWMYASPVIYSVTQIPEKYQYLYYLNPMAAIITTFRYIVYHGNFNLQGLLISIASTVTLVIVGIALFQKSERTFMDTV